MAKSTKQRSTSLPGGSGTTRTEVPRTWSAACALAACFLFASLAPQVSGDKDSSEFALVLATCGVAHPTGYPIYTLLGHLFVKALHATGAGWPFAANVWSSVGAAVATYFLQRLALSLSSDALAGSRAARFLWSLVPAAWLAVNPVWTGEASLAEVYSWHVAWALGTAHLFVMTARWLEGAGASGRPGWRAWAWGAACGLGGAHHATSLFVAGPLSVALAALAFRRAGAAPARVAATVAAVLGGALVPLSSDAFLLWRAGHPAEAHWPMLAPGLAGWWAHVSGSQYWTLVGRFAPSPEQSRLLASYVWPYLGVSFAASAAAALLARHSGQRIVRAALLVSAGLVSLYTLRYGVTDPASYFLLPIALGLAALPSLAFSFPLRDAGARRLPAIAAACLLALAALAGVPWLRVARDRAATYERFEALVHSMWRAVPAGPSFVFWTNDMYPMLRGYQLWEGEHPDAEVLHAFNLTSPIVRERFAARHGFDPAAGWESAIPAGGTDVNARYEAVMLYIENRVNSQGARAVLHFDPAVPTVRLLEKAASADTATAR
ncbi:MAG: DUF2723 domain-containing protein [Candidatus Eisenbacteria bacterium]|uniref:DUF2723 domain-containing protein n=1 Tax=Eiseniibacteriota bacterium TaxID=2212470 RepID=A0A933SJ03_UNCEI|nr:DUF2723 domain-containing protein [Candidatus Eisenbacteria bacterium]